MLFSIHYFSKRPTTQFDFVSGTILFESHYKEKSIKFVVIGTFHLTIKSVIDNLSNKVPKLVC